MQAEARTTIVACVRHRSPPNWINHSPFPYTPSMKLRPLGSSPVLVSPVTFGAWAIGGWMWGGNDDRDAIAAIKASIDNGVNTIDTAAIYGMGHSEKLVGEAIKGRRDDVVIATKCGMRWNSDEGSDPWDTVD